MVPIEKLEFAQRFPFSVQAQKIVKKNDFSLDEIPEEVLDRAKAMVSSALQGKPYFFPQLSGSKELLLKEVLAFPLAKILVSLVKSPALERKFSKTFSDSAFKYLKRESDELLFELASDLGARFSLSERKAFLAEIKLTDFLSAEFSEDSMKLVNQNLEKGKVFLSRNDFIRFLASLGFQKIRSSFPLKVTSAPEKFKEAALELREMAFKKRKGLSFPSFSGKIQPDKFPPCMAMIYSDFLDGKKVQHLARFDLATFLAGINCPEEGMVALFRNAPNFNEKITRYQFKKIRGHGTKPAYSPPSCAKIKTHKLCFPDSECKPIKHPLQYYRNRVFSKRKR